MTNDSSYSFFGGPNFEDLGNLSNQLHRKERSLSTTSCCSLSSKSSSTSSVDSSFGYFSEPTFQGVSFHVEHTIEECDDGIPLTTKPATTSTASQTTKHMISEYTEFGI